MSDRTTTIDTDAADVLVLVERGADGFWLTDSFVRAVAARGPARILAATDETLASHTLVFAAASSPRSRARSGAEWGRVVTAR